MKDYILDSELLSEKTTKAYTILSDILPILYKIEDTSQEAFHEINAHDELGYVDYTSIKSNIHHIEEYQDKYKVFGNVGNSGSIYNCKDMTGVCYNGFIGEYQSEVDDIFYYDKENTLNKLRDTKLQDIYVDNNVGIISPLLNSKAATSIYKDKINIFDLLGYGRVSIALQKEYADMKAKIEECDNLKKTYLEKSFNQLIYGNYTDDVTLLGTGAQIATGIIGIDLPGDLRDISADFVHWEWSWKHAGQTALDMVGVLPVIGVLKYADEIGILVKNSDKAGDIIKWGTEAVSKLHEAINVSSDALHSVITKVYSRTNGVVDAEFAGFGRLSFKEPEMLKDADQICKDRYTSWIEGKLTEGGSKADLEVNPFNEAGKLKPNIKYKAGEFDYLYETDEMGRINKFETDNLKLTERESRLPHNPDTLGKLDGDHAGHLAGDRFGGSPELDNLVSQSSNVNLSQYKKIENQWATAIKEGKQVKVNVEIKYDGDGLRPSEFNVKYEIDGKRYRQSILN